MGKKNLTELAKKGEVKKNTTSKAKATTKKPTPKKKTEEKVVNKVVANETKEVLDMIEEKKQEAKNRVEELLYGSDVSEKDKKEIIALDNKKMEQVEWLEQQNKLLSDGYEEARAEVAQMKERLAKNESIQIENQVIKLFEEIQGNYISMGRNKYGESNLRISPPAFLNRMIMFFPFLKGYKRFN